MYTKYATTLALPIQWNQQFYDFQAFINLCTMQHGYVLYAFFFSKILIGVLIGISDFNVYTFNKVDQPFYSNLRFQYA